MEAQPLMNATNAPVNTEQNGEKKACENLSEKLKDNLLLILTLGGVCLGFGLGFGLRQHGLSESGLMWLGMYPYYTTLGLKRRDK